MEHLTKDNFDDKKKDGTVIVDFYADWCGPCKHMAPVFQELSEEMKDVKFFKVNVEEAQDLAAQFGVRSIPTLIIFKDGNQVEEIHGFVPKETIKDKLEAQA